MSSGDVNMFVLGLRHHFAAFGKMMKISSYFSLQSLFSPLTGQTPCITMLSKKSRFEELQLNTQNLQKHFFSQDGYFYLLQRYLQTKFAGCQAQEIFLTLTGKLLELHRLNDAHTKVNHGKILQNCHLYVTSSLWKSTRSRSSHCWLKYLTWTNKTGLFEFECIYACFLQFYLINQIYVTGFDR